MPCFRPQETDDMSSQQRLSEIATILARGVLRLKTSRLPQNSSDSTTDPLEVSGDSRLSVTTG